MSWCSGVGANFIYPLLGIAKHGWSFAGSEINQSSIEWAEENIIKNNKILSEKFIGIRR
jgi:23S rRNA (adenine1618-N6)-methyltransferase